MTAQVLTGVNLGGADDQATEQGTLYRVEPTEDHGGQSPKGDQRWTATGSASKSASMAQLAELGRTVANGILESAEGKLPAFGAE